MAPSHVRKLYVWLNQKRDALRWENGGSAFSVQWTSPQLDGELASAKLGQRNTFCTNVTAYFSAREERADGTVVYSSPFFHQQSPGLLDQITKLPKVAKVPRAPKREPLQRRRQHQRQATAGPSSCRCREQRQQQADPSCCRCREQQQQQQQQQQQTPLPGLGRATPNGGVGRAAAAVAATTTKAAANARIWSGAAPGSAPDNVTGQPSQASSFASVAASGRRDFNDYPMGSDEELDRHELATLFDAAPPLAFSPNSTQLPAAPAAPAAGGAGGDDDVAMLPGAPPLRRVLSNVSVESNESNGSNASLLAFLDAELDEKDERMFTAAAGATADHQNENDAPFDKLMMGVGSFENSTSCAPATSSVWENGFPFKRQRTVAAAAPPAAAVFAPSCFAPSCSSSPRCVGQRQPWADKVILPPLKDLEAVAWTSPAA